MREIAAIVESAIDINQLTREILKEHIALQDDERSADAHERKSVGFREAAARRRVEIGRRLIEVKAVTKHGGWLPYLEKLGIEKQRASEWMRLAGFVETEFKSPTSANDGHLMPTLADAGIDKRPRKREEQPDQPNDAAPLASYRNDIDRALMAVDKTVMSYAKSWPKRSRLDLIRTLRSVAARIEQMTED